MKCAEFGNDPRQLRRSREGAWIEIEDIFKLGFVTMSRSREGAWIEICWGAATAASAAGRSREGAWIEIKAMVGHALLLGWSLPRGSVD